MEALIDIDLSKDRNITWPNKCWLPVGTCAMFNHVFSGRTWSWIMSYHELPSRHVPTRWRQNPNCGRDVAMPSIWYAIWPSWRMPSTRIGPSGLQIGLKRLAPWWPQGVGLAAVFLSWENDEKALDLDGFRRYNRAPFFRQIMTFPARLALLQKLPAAECLRFLPFLPSTWLQIARQWESSQEVYPETVQCSESSSQVSTPTFCHRGSLDYKAMSWSRMTKLSQSVEKAHALSAAVDVSHDSLQGMSSQTRGHPFLYNIIQCYMRQLLKQMVCTWNGVFMCIPSSTWA